MVTGSKQQVYGCLLCYTLNFLVFLKIFTTKKWEKIEREGKLNQYKWKFKSFAINKRFLWKWTHCKQNNTILDGFLSFAKAPRLSPLGKILANWKKEASSPRVLQSCLPLGWGVFIPIPFGTCCPEDLILPSRCCCPMIHVELGHGSWPPPQPWMRSPSKVTLCSQMSISTPRTTGTSWCGWMAWGNLVRS